MKRIPPYVVVALCGLLFVSAGLIGMFADSTDGTMPTDAAVPTLLPTETPTLTPLPVEVVAPVQPTTVPVVEQPPAAPVENAPVVVVPAEAQPLPATPVEVVPIPTAVTPVEVAPVEIVPAEGAPVEIAPVVEGTVEVVPPDQPLPEGVVPIPTALPPVGVTPVESVPTEEVLPTQPVPVEVIPTEVVPVEGVPVEGRDSIPSDAAAAPVATRGVPVDLVVSPTPEVPAADATVPVQPLPVNETPVIPTLDPAVVQPTPEVIVATEVPVDGVVPAVSAQISGLITFPDAQDHSGIVILLTLPDGTQLQNTTGAPGTFEFLNLQPGTYRAEASSTGYLSRQIEFTLAEGQTIQLPPTFLIGGDTNFDNIIDLSDAALVALNFDAPAVDLTSDPNRDGWIDVRDLALIGADFGLTGPIPWQ